MKRCIAILLCLVLIIPLTACNFVSKEKKSEDNYPSIAFIDDQEVGHVLCDSGNVLNIPNTKYAWVTSDRKMLIWVSESGTMYRIDYSDIKTNLTKMEKITGNVDVLWSCNDKGSCFSSSSGELYRVIFEDNSTTKVADSGDDVTVTKSMDLFFSAAGKVYYLSHDSNSTKEIGTYTGEVIFWPLSENDGAIVWVDYNEAKKTDTVYYYNGANNVKLYEMPNLGYGSDVSVESSRSGRYAAVYSTFDQVLFVKAPNKDFHKVEFTGTIVSGICTNDGYLSESDAIDNDGIYVSIEQDDSNSLYWVTFDGDKEKILSKILYFAVSRGTLCYLTSDNALYTTTAAKAVTSGGEQALSDVDDFLLAPGFIYYIKDTELLSGSSFVGISTLYAYSLKDRESIKVADNIYSAYYGKDSIYCRLRYADDGKTVLYLRNPEEHNYTVYGTLFRYSYGDKEPERIMGEVSWRQIYSLKKKLSSYSIFFAQYIDKDTTEKDYRYDWYYYNGKESITIARNAK